MITTPAAHGLDLGLNAPGYIRSPGLHMSTIYNSLYEKLEPKRYNHDTPMPMDKLEMGMTWEESLEAGFKVRPGLKFEAWRPSEFRTAHAIDCPLRSDDPGVVCGCGAGIAYSPDLIIANGHTRLGEIKLTWMTARYVPISVEQAIEAGRPDIANTLTAFDKRYDKWFTQIKAYLYHLGLLDATLIVLFVNGNYKPPSPFPLAWDVHFTQRELEDEWTMLANHARAEGLLPASGAGMTT